MSHVTKFKCSIRNQKGLLLLWFLGKSTLTYRWLYFSRTLLHDWRWHATWQPEFIAISLLLLVIKCCLGTELTQPDACLDHITRQLKWHSSCCVHFSWFWCSVPKICSLSGCDSFSALSHRVRSHQPNDWPNRYLNPIVLALTFTPDILNFIFH